MKNILNKDSNKVLVQGLGRDGSFQTEKCIEFGTEVVAGVHPTKAGENFKGIPIFGSVDEAVSQTSPDIGLIFVPAPFASDAIIEQVDAGIETVVCITEGIPVNDMLKVNNYIKGKKVRLIGPNCPGFLIPRKKQESSFNSLKKNGFFHKFFGVKSIAIWYLISENLNVCVFVCPKNAKTEQI